MYPLTNLASFCDGRNCWSEAQNLCKVKATGQCNCTKLHLRCIQDGYIYECVSGFVQFVFFSCVRAMISPSMKVATKVCVWLTSTDEQFVEHGELCLEVVKIVLADVVVDYEVVEESFKLVRDDFDDSLADCLVI